MLNVLLLAIVKLLGLELLLKQIGGIFRPYEKAPEDDKAALSAQVHKVYFEDWGVLVHQMIVMVRKRVKY